MSIDDFIFTPPFNARRKAAHVIMAQDRHEQRVTFYIPHLAIPYGKYIFFQSCSKMLL